MTYELKAIYDSRKSFYGKANVEDDNTLYSYGTRVCEIIDGKPIVHGTYSKTTLRHLKEFLLQQGYQADSKKQIEKDYCN